MMGSLLESFLPGTVLNQASIGKCVTAEALDLLTESVLNVEAAGLLGIQNLAASRHMERSGPSTRQK